jgi:transcriptional regulator with XRE-family HTH domain
MVQEPNKRRDTSPLRTARLQRHWSQRELAERVDATVSTVKRWERQATVPGPYFRLKLTALFGKSEEELGLREAPVLPAPPSAREVTDEEPILPPVPTATSALWTIPYLRNPYFTGRDDLLDLLYERLATANQDETHRTRRVALTQRQALIGLGGIGKTQIAVEYAYRMREQGVYTHTLWINAASQEALMASFTALADLLPEFTAREETDQQKLMEAIKGWLEGCPQRWLLIFDNADDISLLSAYMPRSGNGSILLTTCAQAVGSLGTAIDVEKMGFLEGTHLLLRRAQRLRPLSDDEVSAAEQLVVALDHFPLALEQAGAYIEETRCSFAHYLHLYQTHRIVLLARRGMQSTNYPDLVTTTWLLSFQNVQRANPAAAPLLQVCAFLAPDHIPEELLRDGAAYWPTSLQEAVTDPLIFDQALEALLRFSLQQCAERLSYTFVIQTGSQ